jgi:hypothetical protein
MIDFFFSVLRLDLRAYTLTHSTSPIFVKGFSEIGSYELFAQAGLKRDPPVLCLLSGKDYRHEPLAPSMTDF